MQGKVKPSAFKGHEAWLRIPLKVTDDTDVKATRIPV